MEVVQLEKILVLEVEVVVGVSGVMVEVFVCNDGGTSTCKRIRRW